MWSSKETVKQYPDPVVNLVEEDILSFVEDELIIYKQNPDNKRLDGSVIVNLALFNLEALNYQNGVDQMKNLLSEHHTQIVGTRMKQLLHTLYIRYGIEEIDNLAENVLRSMIHVFNLKEEIVDMLNKEYNVFWLQPFVRSAYNKLRHITKADYSE